MRWKSLLPAMALASIPPVRLPAQTTLGNTRIEWDAGTRKFACAGTYGRAKKLGSGEIALTYGSGTDVWIRKSKDGRDPGTAPTSHAIMQVYLGTAEADSFTGKSTPFPDIPATGNGLRNSLLALDDSTVMAVGSISGMGKNGPWAVVGRIRRLGNLAVILGYFNQAAGQRRTTLAERPASLMSPVWRMSMNLGYPKAES